jgi:hypothetical protein
LYFIIPTILLFFLINYYLDIKKREFKINEIQSYKFDNNKKDTIINLSDFQIFLPQNFVKNIDDSEFLFFAKKSDNNNYVFFVMIKKLYDDNLIKSYKLSLKNVSNDYQISMRKSDKNISELDLLINQDSKGKVKLVKKDNNSMYVLHISSPIYAWDEHLSNKIINSFKLVQ